MVTHTLTPESLFKSEGKDTIKVDVPEGTDFNYYNSGTNNSMSLLKQFEQYRITESTPIPNPVPIITINGEILATEGNLVTISGACKSGKSAFTAWIIAGAISSNGIINDPL